MTMDRVGILLGAAAVFAVLVAIGAEGDTTTSAIAGTIAVVAGALLALRASLRRREPAAARRSVDPGDPYSGLRDALHGGSFGREQIVTAVQSLEYAYALRAGPSRGAKEFRDLIAMPPADFRRWLAERLDQIERQA
ncbi:MAG: hypothetical protein L3J93_01735 [Thermoplasmata archaeon]|nr:hypothetical protein [Thermoplasmata archaeon]